MARLSEETQERSEIRSTAFLWHQKEGRGTNNDKAQWHSYSNHLTEKLFSTVDYKNLSWVWGVYRKQAVPRITVWHHEACPRITVWHYDACPRISVWHYQACPRITLWHHEACPRIPSGITRLARGSLFGITKLARGSLSDITRLASWCQTVIARDRFVFLPLTPMIYSFSCIPFISKRWFFNNAVTPISAVRHIVMTLQCRLLTLLRPVTSTLTMAYLTSYTTSLYQTRENSRFSTYPR